MASASSGLPTSGGFAPATIADFIAMAKKIRAAPVSPRSGKGKPAKELKRLRVGLLPSFTLKGVGETLLVKGREMGLDVESYCCSYGQHALEALDSKSGLYKFSPDIVFLFVDLQTLLGDAFFKPYAVSDESRRNFVASKLSELKLVVAAIEKNSKAKIVVHNFEVPSYSPLGILETKSQFGFLESVRALNAGLAETFRNNSRVFVFDYDSFCSRLGKDGVDWKSYYLGDLKLSLQRVPALCDEYLTYLRTLASLSKKCIVLDLDNTLWGGIVGEDGFDGIALGPTPQGRPFWEFQKMLVALLERGIILAVNSRNNPKDALKVLREHPYCVLKEKDFACLKINWSDKVSNMKEIAKEVNIGLDSLVFFDDDKANRQVMRAALPPVLTVELPSDPALYCATLQSLRVFDSFQLTEEDAGRGKLYAQERQRQELHNVASDLSEFLAGLGTVVSIERATSFSIPRIAQLCGKTNQFNMTTRRYSEDQVKAFASSKKFEVYSIRVQDNFGDNGITGAVILEKAASTWRVDSFLLSCRVIGRKVEDAVLHFIVAQAAKAGANNIVGEFIATEKNEPAKGFYSSSGFKLASKTKAAKAPNLKAKKNSEDVELWEFDVKKGFGLPKFIKLESKA